MDYFAEAWARTGSIERGYSNRPPDPETMHGITITVARRHGYQGPMRALPFEFATRIAREEYWDTLRLDEISQVSQRVAFELFDTNFNMFEGAAAQFLQRSLNALNVTTRPGDSPPEDLPIDSIIGSRTVARFAEIMRTRRAGEVETILLRSLNALQCADYIRQANAQPWKRSFYAGWVLKRVTVE